MRVKRRALSWRSFVSFLLVTSLLAMPFLQVEPRKSGGSPAGAGPVSAESVDDPLPVLLNESGLLRYVFHYAVDAGQTSQEFWFTVPANATVFTGTYFSATLSYAPLLPKFCNLDLSIWNAEGLRTGGKTSAGGTAQAQIPFSTYSQSGPLTDIVTVGSVSSSDGGLWKASVYCDAASLVGAMFTLTVSILLDVQTSPGHTGPSFEFSVPSNVCKIEAHLDHIEQLRFGLSLWDDTGRRTGGWVENNSAGAAWIPNSVYNTSATSPESVSIEPVLSTDDVNHSGALWRTAASQPLSFSPGYYALALDFTYDSDGDGVVDAEDIDPVHDLCVRLLVTSIRQEDPVDDDSLIDPYLRFAVGDAVLKDSAEGGIGDAYESNLWSRSLIPIVKNSDFVGEYSIWLNVPDSSRTVQLLLQVWDHDNSHDDICDISPVVGGGSEKNQDSSTLHINYDIFSQTCSGDVSNGNASGEADGSYGSSGNDDEDDVQISFEITTTTELDRLDKVYLADAFAPVVHLDPLEDSGPLEIFSMLNQSELRNTITKKVLDPVPTSMQALAPHEHDSYLRLRSFETHGYRTQVYANVRTTDNDTIVIQYWFFYLYDSVSPHQGDWEMIQVTFGSGSRNGDVRALVPVRLAYSQHFEGEVREWNASDVILNGTHPNVFVSLGGHASIFSGPQGPTTIYPVTVLSPSAWTNFSGHWGSSRWKIGPGGNSVPGPVYRCTMQVNWLGKPTSPIAYIWQEPLCWETGLD
jgi:hypothetical protein